MLANKKLCFVIGPIGDEGTDVRVHADWLLDAIIQPVMAQFAEFVVERADKLTQPGLIDAQVINRLLSADLCIADLSLMNPNAFYEIGIRHMAQKPIIHMHQVGEPIPFDVSLYRSIKFSRRTPADLKTAQEDLRRSVEAVLANGYLVENPVTNARGRVKLEQSATPEERVFIDRLTALENRVARSEAQAGTLTSPPNEHITLDIHILDEEWDKMEEETREKMKEWLTQLFEESSLSDDRGRIRLAMPNNEKNRKVIQHFRTLVPDISGIRSIDIY